jgi:hypothetical protein
MRQAPFSWAESALFNGPGVASFFAAGLLLRLPGRSDLYAFSAILLTRFSAESGVLICRGSSTRFRVGGAARWFRPGFDFDAVRWAYCVLQLG